MDSAFTLHRPPLYLTAALILALSMLGPSHLRAQPWPSRLNAPYPDANVTAIAATESYVYVSTDRPYAAGGIFRSSDNGITWDSVSNENHCWQMEASGSHVYALTNNSYFAHSSDNGATWSKENGLNAVAGSAINLFALGDGSVYVLTTNHHVYRSADHGATATDISKTPEFGDHLFWLEGLAAEGSEVYVADRQQTLFYSLNNGSSWSTQPNLGGLPVGRILLASRGNIVMATAGSVYASTDRGSSWEEVIDNVNYEIKRMAQNSAAVFLSSSSSWGASIYQSDDRGETWNEITSLDTSVTGIAVNSRYVFLATPGRGVYRYALGSAATEEIGVWQEFALPAGSEQFPTDKQANFVTVDGKSAKVIEAHPDTLIIRAPESLIGPRQGVTTWPDTNRRNVDVVARRARAPGDTVEIARMQVVFVPPRPLLYDELVGPSPALVQGLLPEMGPRWRQSFMFIGRPADGTAAVRLTNTTKANQAPAVLLGKVISPDNIYYDGNDYLTSGNLPNVGMNNASQQFPVSVAGIYLIICEARSPASAPGSFASPGPFPARFQIHLAGNAGLPQAVDESGRAIRLDTYFNSPAPREQILGNMDPPLGQIAQTGLSKFANPVSTNPNPIAVLVPPAKNGFPLGTPPVRSSAPVDRRFDIASVGSRSDRPNGKNAGP